MGRPSKHSPEVRERAVRMVLDHTPDYPSQWAAIRSVGEKLGIRTESLRRWVRQAERDAGQRPGLTSEELKRLQRENFELKRANETLRKASAFFAQAELDAERSDGRLHRSAQRDVP
jgi:transposase